MTEGALAGKRVFVVGGETALGRAVLIGLAEAGADIAIASLTAAPKAEFAINTPLNALWAPGRRGVVAYGAPFRFVSPEQREQAIGLGGP